MPFPTIDVHGRIVNHDTRREMEYVSLTRDTTESDLKQRREIIGGTAVYCDQSAVQASLEQKVAGKMAILNFKLN